MAHGKLWHFYLYYYTFPNNFQNVLWNKNILLESTEIKQTNTQKKPCEKIRLEVMGDFNFQI